ncbi:uncharacterized protein [Cardiocondyla obscurior]|uniref:uncharacterized protein n=1 Tax=Cardiocondyla obscurior TaxID=286306 RepID=UPI0039655A83
MRNWMDEKEEGTRYLIGEDFNVRTGKEGGLWDDEKEEEDKEERKRKTKDKKITGKGKKFCKALEEAGWGIVNGCTRGDEEGEWTYVGGRGKTVIDYVISNVESKGKIVEMNVGEEVDSDHLPLIVKIKREGGKRRRCKYDRRKLVEAMKKRGVREGLIRRCEEILEETVNKVKVKDKEGKSFWTTKGVRQGCPLSPNLFTLLLADIDEELEKGGWGGRKFSVYHGYDYTGKTHECDAKPNIPGSFAIEAFDPATTSWRRWVQRLQGAFLIFHIVDNARVPYLLHYVGPAAFDVLCDRLDPADPFLQSYDTLVLKLAEFYEPTPLEIAENFKFHQRRQEAGESVQQYVAALHKLSIYCNFGDYLKTVLRNQFVFGLANKKSQARLLERKDLTFEEAVRTAVTMELSEKSSEQIKTDNPTSSSIDYFKTGKKVQSKFKTDSNSKRDSRKSSARVNSNSKATTKTSVKYYRCGKPHLANKCTLSRDIQCFNCGKRGHLNTVCFKPVASNNQLEEILALEHANHRDKFFLALSVNGTKINFDIDSGAAVTFINEFDAKQYFPIVQWQNTDLQLVSYCGKVV